MTWADILKEEKTFDLERAQYAYDDIIFHVFKRMRGQRREQAIAIRDMQKLDNELAKVKTNEDMKTWIQKFKMRVATLWANDYFEVRDLDDWLKSNGFME